MITQLFSQFLINNKRLILNFGILKRKMKIYLKPIINFKFIKEGYLKKINYGKQIISNYITIKY